MQKRALVLALMVAGVPVVVMADTQVYGKLDLSIDAVDGAQGNGRAEGMN